ncbi:MAG: ATP-binding cassette domain-containing protein [Alphaproteobacteria bacterium]|nr:ATP-binding cassette domain-containing protein [Alphaproteobacteria bacterium]
MLKVRGLHSGYGRIEALHGVDVDVEAGEIMTVVGANGAGKTTLLMTVCGHPRAWSGEVLFEGRDITGLPMFEIGRLGIAHVPEGRHIFPRMTVLENLQMGGYAVDPRHFDADLQRVLAYFPQLGNRLSQRGGTLSGGEQQMLAIGRALISRPRMLLLDEPSLGLAPLVVRQLFDIIADINRDERMTVFLIEQNAFQALRLAHRACIMVNGRITTRGTGAELLADPAVQAAYLEGAAPSAEEAP